jgi:tRNA uridine 5-carbamoylmethylation protein Kti12
MIAMGGPSASGKSTLSKRLAHYFDTHTKLTTLIIRSDEDRILYPLDKHLALHPYQDIHDYRLIIKDKVVKRIANGLQSHDILIMDSGHIYSDYRRDLEIRAKENDFLFIGLQLCLSEETCQKRLTARTHDISLVTSETITRQFAQGYTDFSPAWHMIDAEQDADSVYAHAINVIQSNFKL